LPTIDFPAILLLVLAGLGLLSGNKTVAIAMAVLLLLRIANVQAAFLILEKYGLSVGIAILTIGVMSPIASGKISLDYILQSFTHWKSLLAIAIGMLVAYLGGRGAALMSEQPLVVTGLLIGTIIGVAVLRGVPVGPLIAAGILSMLLWE